MGPGSLHVKTAVASTTEEDVVGIIAVGSEIDQFYYLEKEIVYNVLKVLDVKFTTAEKEKFSQYHTKNLQAVVYFGKGLEALDVGEWGEAKSYFRQAVEEDPEFKLAILYRDGCPNATAPGIGALGEMSDTDLADMIETDVPASLAAPTEISTAGPGDGNVSEAPASSDSDGGGGAGNGLGGVSVSW
jgi:hypothetical protein